jgi:hypothetical protein
METKWISEGALAFQSLRDKYNTVQAYIPDIQIGMREDGVLVWREMPDLTVPQKRGK